MKIFFLLLLLPAITQAQALSSIKAGIVKPSYLTKLQGSGGTDTEYQPTPETDLGVAVTMGPIIVFFMASSTTSSDQLTYGDTQASDVELRLHGINHNFDLSYRVMKGFYVNNSKEVNSAWSSANKIQRPDIQESRLRFNYIYTFTPENFQLGIFDQTVVPRESGGSFLIGGQVSKYNLQGTSSLVPSTQANAYGTMGTLKEADISTIKPAVGAGYIFEFSQIYLAGSALLLAGPEWQTLSYANNSSEDKTVFPGSEVQLRASIGYNMEHFFTAANWDFDQETQDVSSGKITHIEQSASAWVGWRF